MATRPNYYCHKCQAHIGYVTDFECPRCHESFIEEAPAPEPASQSRSGQRRTGGTFQVHGGAPFGNATIVIGNGPSANDGNNTNGNGDLGNFLQTILTQIAGGLGGGGGGPQFPFVMHNGGGGGGATYLDPTNLDAFLTQFLNQMGEHSGPAPAPETRINAVPTIKVTAEQANDNLQCAICMDDFKENDEAKRLPCSHHFHEECISRWLRLHGTCPTCRVTLDGDNTTNREYFNLQSNQQQTSSSSSNNNRRNNGDNNGSSTSAPPGGFHQLEFD
ncbi:unnamed protein product [Rotaria socialis]|uniref:RING-type E3 ubiquitin transferase n=1 Tax=Rotaria socialis TaxID=392032 RepID=A0A818BS82_9BILA|nr:unnamed protein product [Rotaria socialis]CAF3412386.1 unnamed protein product [Rotaria socialis]CAF3418573.1 unnamed protein product [Rotaria socialis]CAF3635230.1 unnamed protein product [Rotaria socialis]CAF3757056.1 unnamed protein product [Rotaria socialis]